MLGDRDQSLRRGEELDGCDCEQADRARTRHDNDVIFRRAPAQRGVNAACQGLDEHGRLVRESLRHRMDLARVGDQDLSPPAARVGAVTSLQTDLDRALGHVVAEPWPALGAAGARRVDAAHDAAQRRLDHDARPVIESPYDLVARHKWIAGQRIEVKRNMPADRREVRAADAADVRHHADPVGRRELGLRHVAELEHGQSARGDIGPSARRFDHGKGWNRPHVLDR